MARTAPVPNIPAPPGMNPGAFVAGGGGDGGGKGGKGGKNGDGSEGADGESADDDANGDGNGSGACGSGEGGDCTNCGHNVSAGDPVDVATGTVFTVPKTDMFLPGRVAIDFRRSYSTRRYAVASEFGFGWTHSFAWSITEHRKHITVRTGDGRVIEFVRPAVGQMLQVGAWQILRDEEYYAVRPGNEYEHYFAQSSQDPKHFELRHVRYRQRGHISLQYEGGRLARALDTVGRVVLFHGDRSGHITSIAVPDPHGATLVFARYAYDDRGDLVAATDADGHTTYFGYDDSHRMVFQEYPNGLRFHYRYDQLGRCFESWGQTATTDPAVASGLAETLADGVTAAKGIFHCKLEFGDDYTEVVDSRRLRRFLKGDGKGLGMAVNGVGGVTTRTYDALGRIASHTNAVGATFEYEYDDQDRITRESDPLGTEVRVARDAGGNVVAVTDPAGGVTRIERDPSGEVTTIEDQAGGVRSLRYDAYGQIVEAIDPRGGRTQYEWDAHANCVARVFPNGARLSWTYDYWGRTLTEADAAGAVTSFQHTPSGNLTAITDPLGRVTSYTFDFLGNWTSERLADGSTTRCEFGGLGWLSRVQFPDGNQIRAAYNREGWPQFFENERGERVEFEHDGEGFVTLERSFSGAVTRYTRDLLGNVIGYDAGAGYCELERDIAGRIVGETGPDGETRAYTYTARGELASAMSDGEGFVWEHDPLGRVVDEAFVIGGKRYSVHNQRNPAGDRVGMTTSLGLEVRSRRDAMGRVSDLETPEGRLLSFQRDLETLPVVQKLSGGAEIHQRYDRAKRLVGRTISVPGAGKSGAEPQWVGASPRGNGDWYFEYTPVDEIRLVGYPDGSSAEYEYDSRRRLKQVKTDLKQELFGADAAGNLFRQDEHGRPDRAYGPGNLLERRGSVAYRYDAVGRLVEREETVDSVAQITRFEWNAWGLLSAAHLPSGETVRFTYDPFARRLSKATSKDGVEVSRHHYVWDLVSMVHDVDVAGGEVVSVVYEGNNDQTPLAGKDGDGDWYFFVNHPNGTPERILDGAGRLLAEMEREPWGQTTVHGTAGTQIRFPGQLYDPETGLHYNRYRYYDPKDGRYVSPDPTGLDGGFNLYAYAPNPIGWADPMGWQHGMTVTGSGPGYSSFTGTHAAEHENGSHSYCSGFGAGNACPRNLRNEANAHTEQKFARDLINSHRRGNDHSEDTFNLSGTYPPCPTCHNALRRAAERTGATINYTWRQPPGAGGRLQTVTYPGRGEPTFHGNRDGALGLRDAGYNDRTRNPNTTWGYSTPGSAREAYSGMRNEHWPR